MSLVNEVNTRILQEGQNLRNIYEVETFLGEGAFAEVYRVKHRLFGKQALKIFKVAGSSMSEINQSLEEAVLLSKLGHRSIIRVFDAGVYESAKGDHGYLTMEYLPGGNLYRYWLNYGNKLMPLIQTIEIVRQISEGLTLAHRDSPPIIHRDIKPHNILLGYDSLGARACLSDFGLAKHVSPLQLAASVRGTLIYKAPETFADLTSDSCAGDVWALGVVLYQLLTNNFPYELESMEQLNSNCFDKPLKPAQTFNIQVTAELEAIVSRALAINKSERYQNAGELLQDLIRFQQPLVDQPIKLLTNTAPLIENQPGKSDSLVAQAIRLAYQEGNLEQACEVLAQALESTPELCDRYEGQLKLWRSGKIM